MSVVQETIMATQDSTDAGGGAEDRATDAEPDIQTHMRSRSTWQRFLFMLLCGIIYAITRAIVFVLIVVQFFWALFTGEANENLKRLGHSFALYTSELIDFLSYYTETRPFPFDADWPGGD